MAVTAYIVPYVRQSPELLGLVRAVREAGDRARLVLIQDPAAPDSGGGGPAARPAGGESGFDVIRRDSVVLMRNRARTGYARSVNLAAAWALRNLEPAALWVMNDDIAFIRGLPSLPATPERSGLIGVLSNKAGYQSIAYSLDPIGDYLYPQRDADEAGGVYDTLLRRSGKRLIPVPLVHGFCFRIGSDCLKAVGLLDDRAFVFGYGTDYDLSLRAERAGFTNYVYTGAFVWHVGSASAGRAIRRIQTIRADHALRRLYGEEFQRAKFVTRQRLARHLANFTPMSRG